jgi:hypothetical protein
MNFISIYIPDKKKKKTNSSRGKVLCSEVQAVRESVHSHFATYALFFSWFPFLFAGLFSPGTSPNWHWRVAKRFKAGNFLLNIIIQRLGFYCSVEFIILSIDSIFQND